MKNSIFLLITVIFISCSKEEGKDSNLENYLNLNTIDQENDVIACAASKKTDDQTTFIFFYPIPGAANIKYFETEDATVNPNDFSLYQQVSLPKENVFNGYLQRFVKNSEKEVWCIVTYTVGEKLRTSNPIRLKNKTKSTEWTDTVGINSNQVTKPKFSWQDGLHADNEIYFQVVSDNNGDLLSGTYTYEKWFQYYELGNVVLNVTRETPPQLVLNNSYSFTMMGVSIDNWVNLVIQKDFQIK